MRRRPSARLIIIDSAGRLLLFRFVHSVGALAGQDYWATPGGGVEEGETFERAAIRELAEETGIRAESVCAPVAQREVVLQLPDGEYVIADEQFFLINAGEASLSRHGWTTHEAQVMADHRWWSQEELAQTTATVWPRELLLTIMAAQQARSGS